MFCTVNFLKKRSYGAVALFGKSAVSNSGLGRRPGKTEITYGFVAGAAALLVAAGLLSAFWSPRLP